MDKEEIDARLEDILNQESATGRAVTSLITVKPRKVGEDSDVELKTDLTQDEVAVHTVVDLISGFLEMTPQQFTKQNVISQLVNKKERKLISKDRKSRQEIVEVSRQPDLNMTTESMKGESVVKRFLSPRRSVR